MTVVESASALVPEEQVHSRFLKPILTGVAVLALEGAVIGGALYATARSWPAGRLTPEGSALARISAPSFGEQIAAVRVTDPSGHLVAAKIVGGKVLPVGAVAPATRLGVTVTVERSRWIGWLLGDRKTLHTVVRTPAAAVGPRYLHPLPGRAVRVRFRAPVRVVSIAVPGQPVRIERFVHPRRLVPLGVRAAGPNLAGSALVAGTPRTWEQLPAPVRVSWFPGGRAQKAIVRPAPGARIVPSTSIAITFSRTVTAALGGALPRVAPRVAGTWRRPDPHTLVFQPSGLGFPLGARVHLVLPRGIGIVAGTHARSVRAVSWSVPGGSPLRLKQLLAQMGYLPVTWQPSRSELSVSASAQVRAAVDPPSGSFSWKFPATPGALKSLWRSGTTRPTILKGAIMAFESAHGLTPDGVPGPAVWNALLHDSLSGAAAKGGYSYVYVSENRPETLTLWHNGRVILRTLVNTGIPGRETDLGTFPVYLHLSSTTMSGTNPDGSKYHDTGVPWVNYFSGGDAVHGFVRPGYGYPQSLGCVEVEPTVAGKIFPYVQVGTLVTVTA